MVSLKIGTFVSDTLREPIGKVLTLVKSNGRLLLIVTSEGGPPVVHSLLSQLPEDFPVPIVLYAGFATGALEPICNAWNKTTFLSVEAVSGTTPLVEGRVYVLSQNMSAQIERIDNGLKLAIDWKTPVTDSPALVSLIRSAVRCLGDDLYVILSGGMKRNSESVIEAAKLVVEKSIGICFAADPALRSSEHITEIPLKQLGIPSTSADELARRLLFEYGRTNLANHSI